MYYVLQKTQTIVMATAAAKWPQTILDCSGYCWRRWPSIIYLCILHDETKSIDLGTRRTKKTANEWHETVSQVRNWPNATASPAVRIDNDDDDDYKRKVNKTHEMPPRQGSVLIEETTKFQRLNRLRRR